MTGQNHQLKVLQFGDPLLRKTSRQVKQTEIGHPDIQHLITSMTTTLRTRKLGVGLAAPQVGKDLALAVISIHPTAHRPNVTPFDLVIINPKIVATKGKERLLWEGCISSGEGQAGLFARVLRYPSVRIEFYDETGTFRREWLKGLAAHVAQHEIDHLNGKLFVDRVTDTKSYMTYAEYKKRRKKLVAPSDYDEES